jgi:hypothetical protein
MPHELAPERTHVLDLDGLLGDWRRLRLLAKAID